MLIEMSVLLTGGNGFIGSNCAAELIKNNFDVIIVDNLSNSDISTIKNLEYIRRR